METAFTDQSIDTYIATTEDSSIASYSFYCLGAYSIPADLFDVKCCIAG